MRDRLQGQPVPSSESSAFRVISKCNHRHTASAAPVCSSSLYLQCRPKAALVSMRHVSEQILTGEMSALLIIMTEEGIGSDWSSGGIPTRVLKIPSPPLHGQV